jgi:hypothetical protein
MTDANFSLPDAQVDSFVPPNVIPDSDPSESVLYMAQLEKAMTDLKDPHLRTLAIEELKFFKMAASIIANATTNTNNANYNAIRVQFGSGVEGVKRLAPVLRDIAYKKKAEQIINTVTKDSKVTKPDGSVGNTVSEELSSNSPFHL